MVSLCYEYNNKLIKTKTNSFIDYDNFNTDKIIFSMRQSLMKKFKITLEEYLHNIGFEVKKCGFCGSFARASISIDIIKIKNRKKIIIKDVLYPYGYYCKGQNKKCDGRNYNPNSITFVSKTKGVKENEAISIIHNRNKSPFYLENHKNYNDYKNYQSLENRLDDEKYSSFIENLKKSKTIEYYVDRFGEKDGKIIWDNICKKKDSMSLDFFLKKNNFNYEKSIVEYKNRLKSSCPNTNFGHYSPASFDFFNKIVDILKIKKYMYGKNELILEYFNENNIKKKFYYDFVDLDNNIIIEYNGLVWHPNKEKMTENQWNNWYFPYDKSIKAEDIINKDKLKEKIALENKYKFISIWNSDDENENLEKIVSLYKNLNIIK